MSPKKCPVCESNDILEIVYGLIQDEEWIESNRDKYILGGCELHYSNPDWFCRACKFRWYDINDPARVKRLRNMLKNHDFGEDEEGKKRLAEWQAEEDAKRWNWKDHIKK